MMTDGNQPDRLLDAVEHLEAVAFVPAKQRYTDASQLAKTIASNAYENGIPEALLARILKILTANNNLDQATVMTLIKNLYPQQRIGSRHLTHIICCLGPSKSKPSAAIQALLLRWLILCYDFMDDRTYIGKLYAVLFNHLDMISLRKPLCHLLSLVTRRKHVKPFRIQALMELIQNAGGEEKELVSLLRIFKNYCPEIIIGDMSGSGRAVLSFKHPDPEWSNHAKALQAQYTERSQMGMGSRHQVVLRGEVKRSKIEVVIPVLQTSRVSNKFISLEEIRDIGHFVDKLDKIDLPNQIISTLGDAIAQKYLHLVQSDVANHRLDEWLRSFLEDKVGRIRDDYDDEPETLTYVLNFIMGYVSYTKYILPSARSFLESYLKIWNGHDNRHQVLYLLQHLPLESFDSLRTKFLLPLESAILDGTIDSMTALLDFYCSLISEWGIKIRNLRSVSSESSSLTQMISHVELLASSIQELAPTSNDNQKPTNTVNSSVLRFYKCLARLFSHAPHNALIRLTVPPAATVYSLSFTPSVSEISLLASILAVYKSSFEASLTSNTIQVANVQEPIYDTKLVSQFNGYVMDMCNLLWRNRALNTEDPNALGCLLPVATTAAFTAYVRTVNEAARHYDRESFIHLSLPMMFSLSYHAAFCNMSAACVAGIEKGQQVPEHRPKLRKPVTQKVLQALETEGGAKITWQDYRVHMLDWLDAVGSRGTSDLMRNTMKALRKE